MYKLDRNQRETLLYILDRIAVTGPDQGGLLNNAAGILRSLKPEPEAKAEAKAEKEPEKEGK